MTNYRRTRQAGATWFFTVALAHRDGNGLLTRRIDALREAVIAVRRRHPFSINAMVVLPDHWHAIWTLPPGDADYSNRMRQIKSHFSRSIPESGALRSSHVARQERGLWQRRFWEHQIRDDRDFAAHVDYIHFNPVKHGYVTQVRDWPHSSFHRYVAAGDLAMDWAGTCPPGVGRE